MDKDILAIPYVHIHATRIINDVVSKEMRRHNLVKGDVHDIVGYPQPGCDKEYSIMNILMFVDRKTSAVDMDKPVIGWRIETEYKIENNAEIITMGPNCYLFTCDRKPTENEIRSELKTNGNEPYRIHIPLQ